MSLRYTLFLSLAALAMPTQATSHTTEATYKKVLEGIQNAKTDEQLLLYIRTLHHIDLDKLKNPFQLLSDLSQIPSLRKASLPIKTYFTYQLYRLCLKIFYAQVKKERYITTQQKKEITENLNLLWQAKDTAQHSAIINNIACVIAFIKILPQNDLSKKQAATLHQLIGIFLKEEYVTQKALENTLQAQLKQKQDTATYLILLELFKVYYLQYVQKDDEKAFPMLITPLLEKELPTTVQYRRQQILGEILRTLINKEQRHKAYHYRDQLLPFMPTLLLPLSSTDPLDDNNNRLLAEGLLIEWCLLSPYRYTLFDDMKKPDHTSLEAKIQAKINEKNLKEWYADLTPKLKDLFDIESQGQLSALQQILMQQHYFQTLHFLLLQDLPSGYAEEDDTLQPLKISLQKLHTQIQASNKERKKDQDETKEALQPLKISLQKLHTQIQVSNKERKKDQDETKEALQALKILEKLLAQNQGLQQKIIQIQQAQEAQQKTLQTIQKNTPASQLKEKNERLSDYPLLHPPYIGLLTLLLLVLLILLLGVLIHSSRQQNPH